MRVELSDPVCFEDHVTGRSLAAPSWNRSGGRSQEHGRSAIRAALRAASSCSRESCPNQENGGDM
jgi:hypothetical protein